MIRTLCTFLVLACVAGLSGVLTGHLWNRYAEENGFLGFSEISNAFSRPEPASDVCSGILGPYTDPRDSLIREASAFEE